MHTEARDEAGNLFGAKQPISVDFLRREAASSHPPPETVRRLVHAVLRTNTGSSRTTPVSLAHWDSRGITP